MARRATGGRRMTIPGLSDALADRWRRFDQAFTGVAFGDWLAAVESGRPITVDGLTIWTALCVVSPWQAKPFEYDEGVYTLTGVDTIETATSERQT